MSAEGAPFPLRRYPALQRNLRNGVKEGQPLQNLVEDLPVTDPAIWERESRREELRGWSERFPIISYSGAKLEFSGAYKFL
jgi:hypothetical protein